MLSEIWGTDGGFLKNYLAEKILKGLDKAFTIIDIYNISMSRGAGHDEQLQIPVIGGVTSLIMDEYDEDLRSFLLEDGLNRGYVRFARVMNSQARKRSGLMGVYVTKDVMLSILNDGGLNFKIHNPTVFDGEYPDNPLQSNGTKFDYFIFFPKKTKDPKASVVNFGVLPIQ